MTRREKVQFAAGVVALCLWLAGLAFMFGLWP